MQDVKTMTDEELETEFFDTTEAIASIKSQIDNAKRTAAISGIYADTEWFGKASAALKLKGVWHQRLSAERGRRRREANRRLARSYEQCFIKAARDILDPDLYDEIVEEAKQLQVQAER